MKEEQKVEFLLQMLRFNLNPSNALVGERGKSVFNTRELKKIKVELFKLMDI